MFLIENQDVEWMWDKQSKRQFCEVHGNPMYCASIMKVNNSMDSLMANKGCACAAASIRPGVVAHSNSFDKLSRSLIPQIFLSDKVGIGQYV